jgi:hypothetical protein
MITSRKLRMFRVGEMTMPGVHTKSEGTPYD